MSSSLSSEIDIDSDTIEVSCGPMEPPDSPRRAFSLRVGSSSAARSPDSGPASGSVVSMASAEQSHLGHASPSYDTSADQSPAATEPEIVVWGDHMDMGMESNGDIDADVDESQTSSSRLSSPTQSSPRENTNHHVDDNQPLAAADAATDSINSSLSALTELSELSSVQSDSSSKATTPVDPEGLKDRSRPESEQPPNHMQPPSATAERLDFAIRSKSSIPSDIPPLKYAAECIAAAESSRLNPYALHPEEYHLLRHHISHAQVTTYLNIRNSILRLWLAQPWACVTREQAVGCANSRWFDAASVCHDWLVRRGYINFGCTKLPVSPGSETGNNGDGRPAKRRKVIAVIGAGVSGLGCARQLDGLFKQYAAQFHERQEEPPKIVVLEGRGRVGGRVYSREFKTKPAESHASFAGKRHTAEMGGMIITGFDRGNPMNVLVRGQLGLPYHALKPDTTIYDHDGRPVDPVRDQLVEHLYNDCLDRVSEFKFKMTPSKVVGGNRVLIDEGRDSPGDGSKTIIQAEEAEAALPDALPVSEQGVPEKVNMVPISSDKLTGRVHTLPGIAATLKASEKARQMGWTLKPGSGDSTIDLSEAVSADGVTLGSSLDFALSQYKKLVHLGPQDYRLINWHIANLEYSNATNLHNLSLPLWDIDAGNEWEGQHTMVVGGYQSVARGLLQCPEPLDLRIKSVVKCIKYHQEDRDGPAEIHCEDGSVIEADRVVCTVPLGVLKHGNVKFEPPLPTWKTETIGRLGFGILNKVVLVYDKVFWQSDRHIFGALRESNVRGSVSQNDYSKSRGRLFQWFNVSNMTGLPCLIALMAGDAGFDTERCDNNELIQEATGVLRNIFGKDIPQPVEAVVTRWGSDRFARGSYSSASPDMLSDDYDTMARSVGNLYFAGEHTIGTHPATVHGAYLSGLRAAAEVLEACVGPVEVPTPLILPRDSLLLHKRKMAAADPKQARLEAYEAKIGDYLRSRIGERPVQPAKVVATAYLLFCKANFELARTRCIEARKASKAKTTPNDVRMMTSRMWKDTTAEDRQPWEERAAEQRKAYAEASQQYAVLSVEWDEKAALLRAAFDREFPGLAEADRSAQASVGGSGGVGAPQKYRRLRASSSGDGRGGGLVPGL